MKALAETNEGFFPYEVVDVERGHRPEGFRFSPHIFSVHVRNADAFAVGHGEDRSDSKLARLKAEAEAVERLEMLSLARYARPGLFSSNGWAAHIYLGDARQNAVFEVIERDAVLTQRLTRTPFRQIDPLGVSSDIKAFCKSELARSEFPQLRLLLSDQGIGPAVSAILMNDKGFGVTGHASGASLEMAIESAIGEACRAAHLYLRLEFHNDVLDLIEGRTGRSYEPGVHALAYAYHRPLPAWIFGAAITMEEAAAAWRATADATDVLEAAACPGMVMRAGGFIVVSANARGCQDAFWGPTTTAINIFSLNLARLKMAAHEINLEPHFVG